MSFKLAKLFNAAYDYGDAKLLDYLQAAIGLTEQWLQIFSVNNDDFGMANQSSSDISYRELVQLSSSSSSPPD